MGKNDGRHQRPKNADDESETSRQDDENKHEPERHKQPEIRMGKKTGDNESCCQSRESARSESATQLQPYYAMKTTSLLTGNGDNEHVSVLLTQT